MMEKIAGAVGNTVVVWMVVGVVFVPCPPIVISSHFPEKFKKHYEFILIHVVEKNIDVRLITI